jgi:tetratricopeptide (TPR) repeat protein
VALNGVATAFARRADLRCDSITGVKPLGDERALAEMAKDALRNGRREEAAAILRHARQAPLRDAAQFRTLVDVALVLNDTAAAADFMEAAIAASRPEPAPPLWHRILGEMRAMEGKLDEAIPAFRRALAALPDDADTWRWLARVLRAANDLPAALAACRRVVALAPDDWHAHSDLAVVLTEARAFEEAAAAFDEATARASDAPAIIVERARLDAQRGDRAQAIASLTTCLARHPDHVPALAALALALRHERRFDDAVAAFRRALELAPADATLWCGLGRTWLEAGRADEARAVAASYLSRRPGHAGALALDALARVALGDEGGGGLLDYDRLLVRRSLPLPDGFADLTSFNLALAAVAGTHPTLHRAPASHATAAGLHSGSLLIDPQPAVKGLKQALHVAVADYCGALPERPDHPFVSRRPASAFFDIWCVVMERGGHQIPHIHPEAWLSGVYYPQLPASVRTGRGPEGWLAFGEADHDYPRRIEPRIVHLRPEEGLLVLFPSYFYHRTVPFDGEGTRISVAFDLIPTDG